MAVKKWVLAGSAVLLLVVLGAGYYQFQKTEPLSADAQALIATVQYPEYQANLSNRNFFMAAGIEAATDKEAEELGRLRYHRSWQLLAQNEIQNSILDQDPQIQTIIAKSAVFSSDELNVLRAWSEAVNEGSAISFLQQQQQQMQTLVTKFGVQIDRYAHIYNQDYRDLPMSVFGYGLPNEKQMMLMHHLFLAKVMLDKDKPAEKMQRYQQYLEHLRQAQVVSDIQLLTQLINLKLMDSTIQMMTELSLSSHLPNIKIEPLNAQEMSIENGLIGNMLYINRATGSAKEAQLRSQIPTEVSINKTTAAILPVIELSKMPYPQMLSSLAKGVKSKPYSAPLKYLRMKPVLDIMGGSQDYLKYAIRPRIVDYRIHLFNAIQSGLSVSELNAQDTYGQYTEEGQKLCLELPKEFKAQYESNAALCLMRPVK